MYLGPWARVIQGRNVGLSCHCPHPSSILFPLLSLSFKRPFSDHHQPTVYFLLSFCVCPPHIHYTILPGLSKARSRKQFLKTPYNPQKTANSFYMADSYRLTKHSTYIFPQNSHICTNLGKLNSCKTGLTQSSRITQPALIKPLP
jgi:hypothetical protein